MRAPARARRDERWICWITARTPCKFVRDDASSIYRAPEGPDVRPVVYRALSRADGDSLGAVRRAHGRVLREPDAAEFVSRAGRGRDDPAAAGEPVRVVSRVSRTGVADAVVLPRPGAALVQQRGAILHAEPA